MKKELNAKEEIQFLWQIKINAIITKKHIFGHSRNKSYFKTENEKKRKKKKKQKQNKQRSTTATSL